MNKLRITLTLTLMLALSACSAQLESRASRTLEDLDVPTSNTQAVLAQAQKISFLIDQSDLDDNGRLDSPTEWIAFLSGFVRLVESETK